MASPRANLATLALLCLGACSAAHAQCRVVAVGDLQAVRQAASLRIEIFNADNLRDPGSARSAYTAESPEEFQREFAERLRKELQRTKAFGRVSTSAKNPDADAGLLLEGRFLYAIQNVAFRPFWFTRDTLLGMVMSVRAADSSRAIVQVRCQELYKGNYPGSRKRAMHKAIERTARNLAKALTKIRRGTG